MLGHRVSFDGFLIQSFNLMASINDIVVSNAQSAPGQSITPAGLPPGAGGNPPSDIDDNISISSASGTQEIRSYTVESAGGQDTVTLVGSPVLSLIELGTGNDLFAVNTVGGSVNTTSVFGGDGNDTLRVLTGASTTSSLLQGDDGSDLVELRGIFNLVTVNGGAGNDVVRYLDPGSENTSRLTRSTVALASGADLFSDGGFNLDVNATTVTGGAGRDTVILNRSFSGSDADGLWVLGGGGADKIYGTNQDSSSGENSVFAGAGADFVQTFRGNDSLVGGGGSDTLLVTSGNNVIEAGNGNDAVFGGFGDDTIDAGEGRDTVLGGIGNDSIFGGGSEFQDLLSGGAGNDTIDGDSGSDLIYGDGLSTISGLELTNDVTDFVIGRQAQIITGEDENGNFLTGTTNVRTGAPRPGPTLGEIVSFTNGGGTTLTGSEVIWNRTAAGSTSIGEKNNTSPEPAPFNSSFLSVTGNFIANDEGGALLEVDAELLLAANLSVPDTFTYANIAPTVADYNTESTVVGAGTGNDDYLIGNSGSDTMFGGEGDDTIYGGVGRDIITGGIGEDVMSGGDAADIFVQGANASATATRAVRGDNWTINWAGNLPDVITDFEASDNQTSVIDQVAFSDNSGSFSGDVSANNGNLRFQDARGSADFLFDTDGVVIFRGTYSAGGSASTFTTSNSGADVLAFYSTGVGQTPSQVEELGASFGTQAVVLQGAGNQNFTSNNFFAADLRF